MFWTFMKKFQSQKDASHFHKLESYEITSSQLQLINVGLLNQQQAIKNNESFG